MVNEAAGNDDDCVQHGWNDPKIDAFIEEMLASYDDQPSQEQNSQVCNPTSVPEPIPPKKTMSKKTKVAKKKHMAAKRCSENLKTIWRSRNNVGPISSAFAPLKVDDTIVESSDASNQDPNLGSCVIKMKF